MAQRPESGERCSLRSRLFVGSAPIENTQIIQSVAWLVWVFTMGAPHRTGRDGCASDKEIIYCGDHGGYSNIFLSPDCWLMVDGCFVGACSLSVAALRWWGRARLARSLSPSFSRRGCSSCRPSGLVGSSLVRCRPGARVWPPIAS